MHIGQALKNILNDLSLQKNWRSINILDRWRLCLEETVNPVFSWEVDFLISAGFKRLKNKPAILFAIEDDFYVRFILFDDNLKSLPKIFFKDLETEIHCYVQELMANWIELKQPYEKLPFESDKLNDETVIFEHAYPPGAAKLLHKLAKHNNLQKNIHIEGSEATNKVYIVGNSMVVMKLINLIGSLSPGYYDISVNNASNKNEIKLTNLCTQSIFRYSLFRPDIFRLDILPSYQVPDNIIDLIEDAPMEHIDNTMDLNIYLDKIVLFKTTSSYLDSDQSYLVYPNRDKLKVGIIHDTAHNLISHDRSMLCMLLRPDAVCWNRLLSLSKIKYADLMARPPTPYELDVIRDALLNDEAKFEGNLTKIDILNKIDFQKEKYEEKIKRLNI